MAGKRSTPTYDPNLVEVKAVFEYEFRRFKLERTQTSSFEEIHALVKHSFHLPSDMLFTIAYTDPRNSDLLPITNTENMTKAFQTAMPLLRLSVYRTQEEMLSDIAAKTSSNKRKGTIKPSEASKMISTPRDFRVVSSIVDADLLPDTVRRVKLLKHSSDRPLGFYIRDGTSLHVTPYGIEKVPGIFISRLVPGGLAEGTGLLAVNDEILEVNAIDVIGKTLDQVTDMMVANSQNLIITVKPASAPPSTPRTQPQAKKSVKQPGSAGGATPGATPGTTPAKPGAQNSSGLPSIGAAPAAQNRLDPVKPKSNSTESNSSESEKHKTTNNDLQPKGDTS